MWQWWRRIYAMCANVAAMPKSAPARKPLTETQKADRRDGTDGRGHPNKTRNLKRRQETARRAHRPVNSARPGGYQPRKGPHARSRPRYHDTDHEYR
jgi:hypothetical protein